MHRFEDCNFAEDTPGCKTTETESVITNER